MAGGTSFTGGWNVLQPPKYYEEAATGYASVITTANASGIFGKVSGITVEVNPNTNEFRALGSEDVYTQLIGNVNVRARVMFGIVNTSSTFISYCIKANANASADISRAIHVVWSQKTWENGSTFVTTFFALRGAKPNSLRVSGSAGNELKGEVELIAHSFTFTGAVATSPFNSTFAAEPTDDPWNFEDGGVNPVTWQSRALDVTNFEWNVGRDLKAINVLGSSTVQFLGSGSRGITGTFTAVYESQSTYADLLTATSGSLAWTMKTSAGTFTGASTVLTDHSLPVDIAGETYETYSFKSGTVAAL